MGSQTTCLSDATSGMVSSSENTFNEVDLKGEIVMKSGDVDVESLGIFGHMILAVVDNGM